MKVFIVTEGGESIGFGHITRCTAIYQAFKEKGIMPEFVVNGDKTVQYLLKDNGCRVFNWLEEPGLFDLLQGETLVVMDSYLAEKALYERISGMPETRLAMIDDYNRLDYPKGTVINPSVYGNTLDYSRRKDSSYLLGKDYIILRKEFWNVPRKIIRKKVKNILITFGGMGPANFIKKCLNFLIDKFPEFTYHVVLPSSKDSSLGIDRALNIKFYSNIPAMRMRNLMLNCDIAISGGGQTTYELARLGVATLGICFAENQRKNLEGLHKRKFLKYVGWHNEKDILAKISKGIKALIPRKAREEKKVIGKTLVDGKGVGRIASNILKNG